MHPYDGNKCIFIDRGRVKKNEILREDGCEIENKVLAYELSYWFN
jgi:hypothetical protein